MTPNAYDQVVSYILENQTSFYRLAYSYTKNREAALDVVQNAICKALEKYEDIRNLKYLRTWFYRVLVNECLIYLKKNKKEILCEPTEMKEDTYLEPAYEHKNTVYEYIDALPEQNKTIIILHYYEEMTLKEISLILGVNLNTVKSRLYAGLNKLKKMIMEVNA